MEATYTVSVDMSDRDLPVVKVSTQGRLIAVRKVRTVGDCMNLGALLTSRSTPFLPVYEEDA